MTGECTDSIIYGSQRANDYGDCMKKCQSYDRCHFVTYIPDKKYCLLFQTCTKVEITKWQSSKYITSSTKCAP